MTAHTVGARVVVTSAAPPAYHDATGTVTEVRDDRAGIGLVNVVALDDGRTAVFFTRELEHDDGDAA